MRPPPEDRLSTLEMRSPHGGLDVLIVGADASRTARLESLLAQRGQRVLVVASGTEALAGLAERAPAIVLSEARLPDIDARELCRRIRATRGLPPVSVVLLTPLDPDEVWAALESGADSFLAEPFDEETLLARIRAARANRDLAVGGGDGEPGEVFAFGQRRGLTTGRAALEFLVAACETAVERDRALRRAGAPDAPDPPRCVLRAALAGRDLADDGSCPHAVRIAARIFESAADGIILTDMDAAIIDANPAFCATSGYRREELLGQNPRIMKSNRHDADFYRAMWRSLLETGRWQGEVWDRRKNGEIYPKWLTISTIRDGAGRPTHYVGISSDISAIKQDERQLERLAHYDALTGLPNRLLFRDRLLGAMNRASRSGRPLALLFLDLDGFKRINTNLGHRAGDALLAKVAQRIGASLRQSDTVARLGGDEFTIIVPEVLDGNAAAVVARKILEGLSAPVELDGHEVAVTASIGIALYPQDGDDVDVLLRNADAAMYHVKKSGRNGYRFYSRRVHAKTFARLALETDLRRALEAEELVVHYQPRVALASGAVVGVEALVRWNHPTTGMIPPSRFIPVAEQTRLIHLIDQWVLEAACRQHRAWREAGLPTIRMAVNLSAAQFEQPKLVDRVAAPLIAADMNPADLEVELTESVAMRNPDVAVGTLLDLKAIGIRVAIDDFGTGYSSLAYLKRFPINVLKVDRSFVRDLATDPDNAAIAAAIIGIGHSLGLEVVAEGVENEEQLGFLRSHRCDEVQGYLASRPLPAAELTALLTANRRLLPP